MRPTPRCPAQGSSLLHPEEVPSTDAIVADSFSGARDWTIEPAHPQHSMRGRDKRKGEKIRHSACACIILILVAYSLLLPPFVTGRRHLPCSRSQRCQACSPRVSAGSATLTNAKVARAKLSHPKPRCWCVPRACLAQPLAVTLKDYAPCR